MLSEHPAAWIPWKNVTTGTDNDTCPPYGCVRILNSQWDGKQLIRYGAQPGWQKFGVGTTEDYLDRDTAGVFGFNGPTTVGPGANGQLTMVRPARALYKLGADEEEFFPPDTGGPGQVVTRVAEFPCGPVAGQWYLQQSVNDQFTLHSPEDISPIEDTEQRITTILVSDAHHRRSATDAVSAKTTNKIVDAGDLVWNTLDFQTEDNERLLMPTAFTTDSDNYLVVPREGIYHGCFQAELVPVEETGSQGDTVGMQLYIKATGGNEIATDWRGSEQAQMEIDNYGTVLSGSRHFINVGFQLYMDAGEAFLVRFAGSAEDVTVSNFRMWVARYAGRGTLAYYAS